MAISSSLSKKNKVGSKKSSSRTSIEQQALEGRGRKIYKYFKKMDVNLEDMSLLYLSWLWMYCDPNRDLSVDEFMEMTEDQIHERFDDLKSKGHIQKLINFEKVIELYDVEDDCIAMPYRYAV